MGAAGGEAVQAATSPVTTPPVRPSIEWQTNYRVAGPAEQALTRRLQQALRQRLAGPIQVSIVGGTAVLRGSVVSDEARALAGHLAQFEPGIRVVQNELTVTAPAGAAR
jgi:osmotically-inducible protein OsmY